MGRVAPWSCCAISDPASMGGRLAGKRAIVTGAPSGIRRAIPGTAHVPLGIVASRFPQKPTSLNGIEPAPWSRELLEQPKAAEL
jgi:hypothetical protein